MPRLVAAVLTLCALGVATLPVSAAAPPKPYFVSLQWNLRASHVFRAWHDVPGRGAGITVCVVDTGIAPVPDVAAAITGGTNTVDPTTPTAYSDDNGHGTFVASEIAGRGTEVWGVAPGASLIAIKVLDASGGGTAGSVTAGILSAVQMGCQVINMSLGGGAAAWDGFVPAIRFACRRGMDIAVAAGNDGADAEKVDPANVQSPCLIAVNSLDRKGGISEYSNWNENPRTLSAPGQNIVGDFPNGGAGYLSGTSMASPMVAGALALLRSLGASAHEAVRALLVTGHYPRNGEGKALLHIFYGRGELNVAAACRYYLNHQ